MTSTAISAQGATFSISSTAGGAKTITAAAPGNGTIFTSAAHGLLVGDIVTLAVLVGTISAMNGLSLMIVNKTINTFEVDYDSSALAYTSGGTATPVSWTAVANCKTFTGPDGSAADIDVSNLGSSAKEFRMGLADEGQFSLVTDLDPTDAGQLALVAARAGQTQKNFKLTYNAGANSATFAGFVKKAAVEGGVDKVLGRTFDIKITGPVTWA